MRLSSPVTLLRPQPCTSRCVFYLPESTCTSFSHPFASSFNFHHSFSICLCCIPLPTMHPVCIACCAVHLTRSPTSNTLSAFSAIGTYYHVSAFSGIHLLPCSRPILPLALSAPRPNHQLHTMHHSLLCSRVAVQCVQHNRQKCIRRRSQALGGLGLGRRGCYLGQQPIPVLTHPAYTHSACNMRHCLQAIFKPSRKQVKYDKRR